MWPLSLSTAAELLCAGEKRCNYKNVDVFWAGVSERDQSVLGARERTEQMINYLPTRKVINLAWNLISPAEFWVCEQNEEYVSS